MMLKDYKRIMKKSEKGTNGIWRFHKKRMWVLIKETYEEEFSKELIKLSICCIM
ncbi:hypothetical protein HanIR_Chr05g0221701 [Helianthus annuus]|nr:hypothetical protein HanIR_Chr05g0221701 [Helianthus annuus]